jgi:RNA polymerase sigma factor (sigma-70 family)
MIGFVRYTDHDILEGVRNSDASIERAFYRRHYGMVRGLVLKRDNFGHVDVDDHYQDVMAIVFTKIKNGQLSQLTSKLSTYIYSVADNLLLYKLRKAGRMGIFALGAHDMAEETDEQINLDALEIAAFEMVKNLRPPCNEIIFDWYLRKLNYDQIAEKHKYKNANTAKKKKGDCISEARAKAKDLLESNNIL